MNELCILQEDVPPFPNQVAFNIIEEDLGQPIESLFSKIPSQTIAAASLGQVYRATLRATGDEVAIKDDPPYAQYEKLHCDMVRVDNDSDEFFMIETSMKNTHARGKDRGRWLAVFIYSGRPTWAGQAHGSEVVNERLEVSNKTDIKSELSRQNLTLLRNRQMVLAGPDKRA